MIENEKENKRVKMKVKTNVTHLLEQVNKKERKRWKGKLMWSPPKSLLSQNGIKTAGCNWEREFQFPKFPLLFILFSFLVNSGGSFFFFSEACSEAHNCLSCTLVHIYIYIYI